MTKMNSCPSKLREQLLIINPVPNKKLFYKLVSVVLLLSTSI